MKVGRQNHKKLQHSENHGLSQRSARERTMSVFQELSCARHHQEQTQKLPRVSHPLRRLKSKRKRYLIRLPRQNSPERAKMQQHLHYRRISLRQPVEVWVLQHIRQMKSEARSELETTRKYHVATDKADTVDGHGQHGFATCTVLKSSRACPSLERYRLLLDAKSATEECRTSRDGRKD